MVVCKPLKKKKKPVLLELGPILASVFLGMAVKMPLILSHLQRFSPKEKASSCFIPITENPYRCQFSYTEGTMKICTTGMQNVF